VGGNQVTRDLSVALGIPSFLAEELKVKRGHCLPEEVASDEEVQLPGFQGQPKRTVNRRAMTQPINERLTEIMKLVLAKLRDAGLRNMPTGGMVITGGTAETPGLQELARKATGGTVRIAYPRGILGLPSELRKPAYSAAVGTLLWGIKHQGEKRPYGNGAKTLKGNGSFSRLWKRSREKVAP
jgi:cell division protein FtsA